MVFTGKVVTLSNPRSSNLVFRFFFFLFVFCYFESLHAAEIFIYLRQSHINDKQTISGNKISENLTEGIRF